MKKVLMPIYKITFYNLNKNSFNNIKNKKI